LGIPGVHAIAIGAKIIAHQRSEQLAIAVFVSKKKPRSAISPDEVVPTEIAGIPTDVIEMDIPQTAVAGAPTAPQLSAVPSGPSAIALTGNDVPGFGNVVVAAITVTSGGASNRYIIPIETVNGDTLATIGKRLALVIHERTAVPANFDENANRVVLAPPAGTTISVVPSVIPEDSTAYTPLVGGIQISCRPVNITEYGTLGCMLVDSNTPPQVYALTCYHVVADWGHAPTPGAMILAPAVLTSQPAPGQATDVSFITIPASGHLATTVTTLTLTLNTQAPFEIISVYTPSTPPAATDVDDAMTAVQAAINNNAAIGTDVTAVFTAGSGTLTIKPNDPSVTLLVTASCSNGDPTMLLQDRLSNLSATVNGTSVTLAGYVNGDNYGVYTILHVGGRVPTYGTFTALQSGRALSDVANDIVSSINQLTADIKNQYNVDVSATATAAGFTVSGAVLVECNVNHDVSVGQPGGFPGTVVPVSGPGLRGYIGKVIAARYDVDAALIQLNPGITYGASVANISGNVAGTATVTLNQSVKKSGRTTGVTHGTVTKIDLDRSVQSDLSAPTVDFGLFLVESSANIPFSMPGDSGSVILVDSPGSADDNKVVGLLIGDVADGTTVAMPIDQVFQALLPRFLQVAPGDGTAPPVGGAS
jgi:hypothetical protein